eukprot:COSAG01_NODE_42523_length_439_cov_0.832353_2_plen_125_part_01
MEFRGVAAGPLGSGSGGAAAGGGPAEGAAPPDTAEHGESPASSERPRSSPRNWREWSAYFTTEIFWKRWLRFPYVSVHFIGGSYHEMRRSARRRAQDHDQELSSPRVEVGSRGAVCACVWPVFA